MNTSFIIAAILNWGVAAALFGIGIDYLRSRTIKPHHAKMLDVPFDSLTPATQLLILTLLKGTGLVAAVTGISMGVLLAEPFARKEAWSRGALLIVAGATLIPTLVGTFQVRAKAGRYAPYWPHVVMICALGVAFWLTRDFSVVPTTGRVVELSATFQETQP